MVGNWFIIVLLSVILAVKECSCECKISNVRLKTIPQNHIYWKLKKPIVIGHLGNVVEYQENTLEGLKSLIEIKADGAHMQVQLTKDNKLILFGEDNLSRMTGEDYYVSKLPYSEIQRMDILQTIHYQPSENKKIEKTYRSVAKIPSLTSALDEMKGKDILLYIEMLTDPAPDGPLDRQTADLIAKLVAGAIQQYQLHSQVIVVSRNAFALKSLKIYDSRIVLGWWMDTNMFRPDIANKMLVEYVDLLDEPECFSGKSNGTEFAKYLLSSGIISKSISASIVELAVPMYSDKAYLQKPYKEIKHIVQDVYGDLTIGTFDIFSLNSTEQKSTAAEDIKFIEGIYKKGVNRFVTSDVNRVKTALHEVVTLYSTGKVTKDYFVLVILTMLFGKVVISLLFL